MVRLIESLVGPNDVPDGHHVVDDRSDLTAADQRPHLRDQLRQMSAFSAADPSPKRSRMDSATADQQLPEIELSLDPALESDDDEATTEGEWMPHLHRGTSPP